MATNGDTFAREAGEHIDNISLGLHLADEDQTCKKLHGDLGRAVIWVIRKVEAICKASIHSGEAKTAKFWGVEIPLERGLSFRDLIILIVLGYFIYVHLVSKGIM